MDEMLRLKIESIEHLLAKAKRRYARKEEINDSPESLLYLKGYMNGLIDVWKLLQPNCDFVVPSISSE